MATHQLSCFLISNSLRLNFCTRRGGCTHSLSYLGGLKENNHMESGVVQGQPCETHTHTHTHSHQSPLLTKQTSLSLMKNCILLSYLYMEEAIQGYSAQAGQPAGGVVLFSCHVGLGTGLKSGSKCFYPQPPRSSRLALNLLQSSCLYS